MQKNVFKNGYSIIEILVSLLIISITFIGIFYYFSYHNAVTLINKKEVENELILSETYELFNYDPKNFCDNLTLYFNGVWENNLFIIKGTQIKLSVIENNKHIVVEIYQDDHEIEKWSRLFKE